MQINFLMGDPEIQAGQIADVNQQEVAEENIN